MVDGALTIVNLSRSNLSNLDNQAVNYTVGALESQQALALHSHYLARAHLTRHDVRRHHTLYLTVVGYILHNNPAYTVQCNIPSNRSIGSVSYRREISASKQLHQLLYVSFHLIDVLKQLPALET